jgi:3-hydroxyisobutyrate dehydrogenase
VTQLRIGVVGLGAMGGAMARRLARSGFTVRGYDVDAARVTSAATEGVAPAASAAQAAQDADVVLSSLPDPAAVRHAYLGADGVLTTVKAGATLVDVSTVDPATWREVADAAAKRTVDCLDAPVSGGPVEAGSGKLVFLVGGEESVLGRCRPVLEALGTEVQHLGPLGSGQIVKLVNNVMSICNVAIAAEAMVLGVRAGMDASRLFETLSVSGGRSHHFLKRFPNVLKGDFTPYFSIGLSRKDLGLALDMAARLGVPMPTASAARQMYDVAAAQGLNGKDMAAVTALYERWAGVEVRGKPDA